MQEIYLIRHGETDWNQKGIIQGRGINSVLNEKGKKQAQAFFEFYKNIAFDAYLASTLQRTHQTLQPFLEQGHSLITHAELDEIDWGIHEGKAFTSVTNNQYTQILQAWKAGNLHHKIEGGESPLQLQKRQVHFIKKILPHAGKKILICSHGRAIRSMLCSMLNQPLQNMDAFPHQNLSLYKIIQHEGIFRIELFNDTSHLSTSE